MSEDEEVGYPGLGIPGAALKDFKVGYAGGLCERWPRYWREFSKQAIADLEALEGKSRFTKEHLDAMDDYDEVRAERLAMSNKEFLLLRKALQSDEALMEYFGDNPGETTLFEVIERLVATLEQSVRRGSG